MSEDKANLFKNIRQAREQPTPKTELEIEEAIAEPDPIPEPISEPPPRRKRGRPATGKRSDPDWIGRTYYVKRETDLDVEGELYQLKRKGVEVDKSELVDSLLDAWVKWRQGDKAAFPAGDILPRRKDRW